MVRLKREAVGQFNYVAPTPDEQRGRKQLDRRQPHLEATVEIVNVNELQKLFEMKPPKMFDTSYGMDFRHPPSKNLVAHRHEPEDSSKKLYTAYVQTSQDLGKAGVKEKQAPVARNVQEKAAKPEVASRVAAKSAGAADSKSAKPAKEKQIPLARALSAEPSKRTRQEKRVNTEFYRSLLKARTGSEWHRKPDVSYDVLNPEKPDPKRKTKPYGAQMENEQEKIASTLGEKKKSRPATVGGKVASRPASEAGRSVAGSVKSAGSLKGKLSVKEEDLLSVARMSVMSRGSSSADSRYIVTKVDNKRPMTSHSSISSIGDDYFLETGRHMNEVLETIQEEEIQEQLAEKNISQPPPIGNVSVVKRKKQNLKKPLPPTDLFKRKGPDSRFYASKKNLRTPNEMERYRKARGRTFMKNVEQAVPEIDLKDHEVKYQPERQLFQDARWKIRQDVKDVRNKNLHSLVDRFGLRHQVIKDEQRTRLGDPAYIGRDPVSVYKLQDAKKGAEGLGFKVTYPLHNRRRITPSMGSVQRARNLGSHAQIFNQSCAPPAWGPQKADHSIFLPPMAQHI